MTDDTTVSPTPTLAAKLNDPQVAIDAQLKHQPPARKKTWGERVFNWGTYGGIALVGNEAASLVITESTKPTKLFANAYAKFENWFANRGNWRTAEDSNVLKKYIAGSEHVIKDGKTLSPRLPYLLLATLGGMAVVPFVKYAEDNKGKIVRKLDRNHYGDLTDSDPKLVEAHKEMDEAPRQSWTSLWKGRATTVVAATIADFTFGWDHALTTKLHPKASLSGIAQWVASKFPKKYEEVAKNGTWLLTLSSTLTVLFFASSKLFAKKQEEMIERKQEERVMRANGTYADTPEDGRDNAQTEPALNEKPGEKPTPQVKSISREDTIVSVPQLSHAAN